MQLALGFDEDSFLNLGRKPSLWQRSVMPVVHNDGHTSRTVGTCFAISNTGLALTARHVLTDAFPSAEDTDLRLERNGSLDVLYFDTSIELDDPRKVAGTRFSISTAWMNPRLDIAIIKLELGRNLRTGLPATMPAFRLSPGIPPVGTPCFAVGYHSATWDVDVTAKTYLIDQQFAASAGTVAETHFPMRDSANLNFPCFRVDARYAGGMSGGPIFSAKGDVFGVVCSSFVSEGVPISYGTIVGPVLGTSLDLPNPMGRNQKPCLYEFIDAGLVGADDTYSDLLIQRDESACNISFKV